jgi:hypothetical protein
LTPFHIVTPCTSNIHNNITPPEQHSLSEECPTHGQNLWLVVLCTHWVRTITHYDTKLT